MARDFALRAGQLSKQRRRWAKALAPKIERELADLALAKARFEIVVEPDVAGDDATFAVDSDGVQVAAHAWGIDRVEYRFSPNPGEELRALSKVASGGELARIYLALQVAATAGGSREAIGLVFDEVDTGIGGSEAAVVGRKLRQLADGGQILAVTHLPQVAACGHRHLQVVKREERGRTGTKVRRLEGDERVEEVARMLGGEAITEVTRSHARELLQQAAALPGAGTASGVAGSGGSSKRRRGAPAARS